MTFIYRGPLPPGSSLFRGRTTELARLQQLCREETSAYAIVYGGRQNGKTSLLIRLAAELATHMQVCTIDLQALPGAQEGEVYAYIAQSVADSLVNPPTYPHLAHPSSISSSQTLIDYLRSVLRAIPTKLCLLFDEVGALPLETRRRLANVLRAMFTNRYTIYSPLERLQVVLAGSIELYDLAVTEVSTLHNVCEDVYLTDLNEVDTVKLVVDGLDGSVSRTAAEQLGEAIYTHANGHPYLTQRLGSYVLDAALAGRPATIDFIDQTAMHILNNDVLVRYLQRSLEEHHLIKAGQDLLNNHVRSGRVDGDMAQLELLGLAKHVDNHWQARNLLLARMLAAWTAKGIDKNKNNRQHLEALRQDHARRLQILEHQAAVYGVDTRPHITTEMEDVRIQIADIDDQLQRLGN